LFTAPHTSVVSVVVVVAVVTVVAVTSLVVSSIGSCKEEGEERAACD
jgi:hypothetical protein